MLYPVFFLSLLLRRLYSSGVDIRFYLGIRPFSWYHGRTGDEQCSFNIRDFFDLYEDYAFFGRQNKVVTKLKSK
jgi:hypothetical protein